MLSQDAPSMAEKKLRMCYDLKKLSEHCDETKIDLVFFAQSSDMTNLDSRLSQFQGPHLLLTSNNRPIPRVGIALRGIDSVPIQPRPNVNNTVVY